jgi:hypothetical protein
MVIMCDSNAAVIFAQKGWGKNSLHYDLKLLYIHECQKKGLIRVEYVPTEFQLADILTKPCPYSVASRLLPHILGDVQKFSGTVVHDEVEKKAVSTCLKPVLRRPAACSLRLGVNSSGSHHSELVPHMHFRCGPPPQDLSVIQQSEEDFPDDIPDLVVYNSSDSSDDEYPDNTGNQSPLVTLQDVAPVSRPIRFLLSEDIGITILSQNYNGISMGAYLLDTHSTSVDVVQWRGQTFPVVKAGTLVMTFEPHYHAHGFRAMLVDAPEALAVLCQEDLCLSRLPSGQYPTFEWVEGNAFGHHFRFMHGLRMEHVVVPHARELLISGEEQIEEIYFLPTLHSLLSSPPCLWYHTPSGVPYGPRRRLVPFERVPVVIDEQFLPDALTNFSGMSFIPTDFLPWLHNVREVTQEPANLVFPLQGTIRFRLYPSTDVLELPCRLAPNMCFQFDLASLLHGRHRNLTSDSSFSFQERTLRLGDLHIPLRQNSQGLLLADACIIPPVDDIMTIRGPYGPRPEDAYRWLFRICDSVSMALIPSAFASFLRDTQSSSPYQPPILGFPVVSTGTLRLCMDPYETPPRVCSFKCAVLARDFHDFVLSQHAIEAYPLPGFPPPRIVNNALHFGGRVLPFRLPPKALSVKVLPHGFLPA